MLYEPQSIVSVTTVDDDVRVLVRDTRDSDHELVVTASVAAELADQLKRACQYRPAADRSGWLLQLDDHTTLSRGQVKAVRPVNPAEVDEALAVAKAGPNPEAPEIAFGRDAAGRLVVACLTSPASGWLNTDDQHSADWLAGAPRAHWRRHTRRGVTQ